MTKSDLLEKYIDMATHNIFCYSQNHDMSKPKEGFEKQWQEAKDELDMLIYAAKLINKKEYAPVGETRERMYYLVESIISDAITVWAEKVGGNMVQVKITDDVKRKMLAVINFEEICGHYRMKFYQLL